MLFCHLVGPAHRYYLQLFLSQAFLLVLLYRLLSAATINFNLCFCSSLSLFTVSSSAVAGIPLIMYLYSYIVCLYYLVSLHLYNCVQKCSPFILFTQSPHHNSIRESVYSLHSLAYPYLKSFLFLSFFIFPKVYI